jgi:hypothetical protein
VRRREVIHWLAGGTVVTFVFGCHPADVETSGSDDDHDAEPFTPDAAPTAAMADAAVDACVGPTVQMHDTYAQALYFDGTKGPLTGTITVGHVIAGVTVTFDFWHGHGNMLHRYTLMPTHFDALKRGEKVTLTTTTVDGHEHNLFIDPRDEAYRVSNAPDVNVPLGC